MKTSFISAVLILCSVAMFAAPTASAAQCYTDSTLDCQFTGRMIKEAAGKGNPVPGYQQLTQEELDTLERQFGNTLVCTGSENYLMTKSTSGVEAGQNCGRDNGQRPCGYPQRGSPGCGAGEL